MQTSLGFIIVAGKYENIKFTLIHRYVFLEIKHIY